MLYKEKSFSIKWQKDPKYVLIVKKPNDTCITNAMRDVGKWILSKTSMKVFIEPSVLDEFPEFTAFNEEDKLDDIIDFVICLGGDGTVLYVNTLFQNSMPPLLAFNMGSLGFLTPFDVNNYEEIINNVIESKYTISKRSRLVCKIYSKSELVQTRVVLNEICIDRGSSPFLSQLECYCDDYHVTTIQADGVIISTATGSTAYNLSAGGSVVHPQVKAILVTPICPHSLSFRPLVLPDTVDLRIQVPPDGLSWVSFDGKYRTELASNDYIDIKIHSEPFITINKDHTSTDWFDGLSECLNWNNRKRTNYPCKISKQE